jgi:hypothetical protein
VTSECTKLDARFKRFPVVDILVVPHVQIFVKRCTVDTCVDVPCLQTREMLVARPATGWHLLRIASDPFRSSESTLALEPLAEMPLDRRVEHSKATRPGYECRSGFGET